MDEHPNITVGIKCDNEMGINFENGYTVFVGTAYNSCKPNRFKVPVSDCVVVDVYFGCKDVSNEFIDKKRVISISGKRKKDVQRIEKTDHFLTANEFANLLHKVSKGKIGIDLSK